MPGAQEHRAWVSKAKLKMRNRMFSPLTVARSVETNEFPGAFEGSQKCLRGTK